MSKFADRLFQLRTANKLTQDGLSNILKDKYNIETNKSMISKYEKGIHEPGFTFIDYVADYFGVTTDWLMGRSDNKYYTDSEQCSKVPVLYSYSNDSNSLVKEDTVAYEITNDTCDFCIRITKDNMIDCGMKVGDLAFIRKQSDLESGQVGMFLINGNTEIYRIIKDDNYIILKSDNTKYNPIIFTKKDFKHVSIIGRVVSVKFNL